MSKQSIAVIGGGITGIAAALELAKSGKFEVTLFEQADHLGGLSDYYTWNGITWDRFYHVILSTDTVMLDFIKDLGLEDRLFWREAKSGFFGDGRLASMSTTLDFIRFPFLSLWQKFRLGLGILYSARIKDPSKLDRIYVREWLTRVFGRRVYESIWDPLLRSKLGTAREKTSAAFIWATITRLYGARSADNKQEKMGHVHGGYKTILDAAEKKLKELGVRIILSSPVTQIEPISSPQTSNLQPQSSERTTSTLNPQSAEGPSSNHEPQTPEGSPSNLSSLISSDQRSGLNRDKQQKIYPTCPVAPVDGTGVKSTSVASEANFIGTNNKQICINTNQTKHFFNKTLLTVNCSAALNMIGTRNDHPYWHHMGKVEYLGVICVLLILSRRLSPYYVINLLDKELPFTGIIEATNIVSPDELDGNHLVYLPKYLPADDRLNSMTDAEITKQFVQGLKKVYPDLKDDEILHNVIFREKFVQPLQELNYLDRTAGIQSPEHTVLAVNTSMIYNSTLNNNAAITLAAKASKVIKNKALEAGG